MTEKALQVAAENCAKYNIKNVVISSNTGETIEKAVELLPNINIVWVSHHFGYKEPNKFEFSDEMRDKMTQKGVKIVTAAHVLSGAERGLSAVYKGYGPVEIMAQTLRMFGQGTKVAVECATMALDAGAIPEGEMIISVGGTGRGVDTALLITPAHAKDIIRTRIHKTFIKPDFIK